MRHLTRPQGFLTFAQNGKSDYLRLAYALALSIRATQKTTPYLSVIVTKDTEIPEHYREVFDEVISIPWIDEAQFSEWKLENEWKAYHVTPYEHTIKLDADMLFTDDVEDWWPTLKTQDVMACTNVESYRGESVTSDFYRKCFTANDLPNIYTAFMYFKICDFTLELFNLVEIIYHNWQRFFQEFLEPITRPAFVSTDVVFALAIKLLGAEHCTFPSLSIPKFVHMKSHLQNWPFDIAKDENWMRHVPVTMTDDLVLKIGRQRQMLPFHYQDKDFLTDEIIQKYERHLH